jgi:hypothetical protein
LGALGILRELLLQEVEKETTQPEDFAKGKITQVEKGLLSGFWVVGGCAGVERVPSPRTFFMIIACMMQ